MLTSDFLYPTRDFSMSVGLHRQTFLDFECRDLEKKVSVESEVSIKTLVIENLALF